ncbi:MAG: hypothetical protein AAB436_00540 [Patescibacteria group bacterium]
MNTTWSRLFKLPAQLANKPLLWTVSVLGLIIFCFALDHFANLYTQWLLAVIGWWVLLSALSIMKRSERQLVMILVIVATIVEFTASLGFNWYSYRLGNIPPWIPPAHGIVFLTALVWSKSAYAKAHEHSLKLIVTVLAISYSVFGLVTNNDVAGASFGLFFLCWLWFTGKSRFYSMLWVLVCYLEIMGVTMGAWNWAPTLPLTQIHEGNPPTGIVGGYGLFDLATFAIAASLVRFKWVSTSSKRERSQL